MKLINHNKCVCRINVDLKSVCSSTKYLHMKKKILYGLLLVFVAFQFYRPARNINTTPGTNDIAAKFPVPDSVKQILQKACNDCHSSNTSYPWYTNIQPVGMWMQHHVDEGKREINFDEFLTYKPRRQDKKMKEIIEQVEQNEMPLPSYTWIHKDAILTSREKELIINWAKATADSIHYVPDPNEPKGPPPAGK
jgi:hypothetical protein